MFSYTLPLTVTVLSYAITALLCVDALRRARLGANLFEHSIWAFSTAFVYLGMRMTVTLDSGLSLHYMGAAFLALLVGFPRALLSMSAVFAIEAMRTGHWETWGLRVLLAGAVPIWAMWLIVSLARRYLPRNPFVFLIGCGLFGQFAAYLVGLYASAIALIWFLPHTPRAFWDDFIPYATLLATGEAWLEGMLTTLLVVYVPGAVRLFDEGFYLSRRS
ncbi:MAG: energy-coupling factor ABC transporter permease [Burkholderiaceae bacterium]|nr:energy-coupling factor ABC transporter permease [Burkholderiaceae bacterium]